jgi:hypothetical protein
VFEGGSTPVSRARLTCLFGVFATALGACGGSAFTSGTGDGGPTQSPDASGDDSPPGDDGGPPTRWCASQTSAAFCADFDEAPTLPPLLGAWTGETTDGGGTLDLTMGPDEPSPPNALRATASDSQFAYLVKSLPSTPSTIHVEFSLRLDHGRVNAFLASSVLVAVFLGPS